MDLHPINWYQSQVPMWNFCLPPTSAPYYPPTTAPYYPTSPALYNPQIAITAAFQDCFAAMQQAFTDCNNQITADVRKVQDKLHKSSLTLGRLQESLSKLPSDFVVQSPGVPETDIGTRPPNTQPTPPIHPKSQPVVDPTYFEYPSSQPEYDMTPFVPAFQSSSAPQLQITDPQTQLEDTTNPSSGLPIFEVPVANEILDFQSAFSATCDVPVAEAVPSDITYDLHRSENRQKQSLEDNHSGCDLSFKDNNVVTLEASTTKTDLQFFDATYQVRNRDSVGHNKEVQSFDSTIHDLEKTSQEIENSSRVHMDGSDYNDANCSEIEDVNSTPILVADVVDLAQSPTPEGYGSCNHYALSNLPHSHKFDETNAPTEVRSEVVGSEPKLTLLVEPLIPEVVQNDGHGINNWSSDEDYPCNDSPIVQQFARDVEIYNQEFPLVCRLGEFYGDKHKGNVKELNSTVFGLNLDSELLMYESVAQYAAELWPRLSIYHCLTKQPIILHRGAFDKVGEPFSLAFTPLILNFQAARRACGSILSGSSIIALTDLMSVIAHANVTVEGYCAITLLLKYFLEHSRAECGSSDGLVMYKDSIPSMITILNLEKLWEGIAAFVPFSNVQLVTTSANRWMSLLPTGRFIHRQRCHMQLMQVLYAAELTIFELSFLKLLKCSTAADTVPVHESLPGILSSYHSMLALQMRFSLILHIFCIATVHLPVFIIHVTTWPNQDSSCMALTGATYMLLRGSVYSDNHFARDMGVVIVYLKLNFGGEKFFNSTIKALEVVEDPTKGQQVLVLAVAIIKQSNTIMQLIYVRSLVHGTLPNASCFATTCYYLVQLQTHRMIIHTLELGVVYENLNGCTHAILLLQSFSIGTVIDPLQINVQFSSLTALLIEAQKVEFVQAIDTVKPFCGLLKFQSTNATHGQFVMPLVFVETEELVIDVGRELLELVTDSKHGVLKWLNNYALQLLSNVGNLSQIYSSYKLGGCGYRTNVEDFNNRYSTLWSLPLLNCDTPFIVFSSYRHHVYFSEWVLMTMDKTITQSVLPMIYKGATMQSTVDSLMVRQFQRALFECCCSECKKETGFMRYVPQVDCNVDVLKIFHFPCLSVVHITAQETSCVIEGYSRQLQVRLFDAMLQRVNWFVHKLATTLHSGYWLDRYAADYDSFYGVKAEACIASRSWRMALQIPESVITCTENNHLLEYWTVAVCLCWYQYWIRIAPQYSLPMTMLLMQGNKSVFITDMIVASHQVYMISSPSQSFTQLQVSLLQQPMPSTLCVMIETLIESGIVSAEFCWTETSLTFLRPEDMPYLKGGSDVRTITLYPYYYDGLYVYLPGWALYWTRVGSY